jgi:CSLREA domain-containing protein
LTGEGGESRRGGLFGALTLTAFAALLFMLVPGAASARTPGATITVTTTADGTGGPNCTLRDAITAANTDTATGGCSAGHGADTIDFSVSGQINLGSTLPAVTSRLTIDGSGRRVAISGHGAVRIFDVDPGASLSLNGLTVANGASLDASGILNQGNLLIRRSSFRNNNPVGGGRFGGAIWNTADGRLTVARSTFSDNGLEGVGEGSAIYSDGVARIEDSTFAGNTGDTGGAIFNNGALTLRNSGFSGNNSEQGGAIWNTGALDVHHCSFQRNAPGEGGGGAIGQPVPGQWGYRDTETLTLEDSSFSETHAGDSGAGGTVIGGGSITVSGSTFTENAAGGIGSGGVLSVANSSFLENNSDGGAGAIAAFGAASVRNSTFSGNVGEVGAIINGGTLTVSGSTFVGNSTIDNGGPGGGAGGPGGAIYNQATLTITNSTFVDNHTVASDVGRGGAIFNTGQLLLKSSTLVGNSAYAAGGGIDNQGTAALANTIVAGSSSLGGNCSGALAASSTSNMADDSSCGPGFTQVTLTDLMLGPLADNGGPTQTIALARGSVAIDAGNNAAARGLLNDQRGKGYARIVNCRVDIGAFEVQQPSSGRGRRPAACAPCRGGSARLTDPADPAPGPGLAETGPGRHVPERPCRRSARAAMCGTTSSCQRLSDASAPAVRVARRPITCCRSSGTVA